MMSKSDEMFIEWLDVSGIGIKPSYTTREISRLLNCALRTVYYMVSDGRIQSVTLGEKPKSSYRIPYPALKAYWERM